MKSVVLMRLLPVVAMALSGCAANSYCMGEQDYQKAESMPPLQPVEGVQVPDSASALRIPPPPANSVAYGETYTDEDGDEAVRCLDKPPAMPPPVIPPEDTPAEKPTEAPAPAAPVTDPAA